MCMYVMIVLFYQNHSSVYKSKISNDFVPYNSQTPVSVWWAALPDPLQMSLPSVTAPLPQISSYTSATKVN